MPDSFDGFCSLGLGANPGRWEWDEGMYSPHQPFLTMFLINTKFSIILNLFDNNKPYAEHAQLKMCKQNPPYLVKYSELRSKN